MLCMQICPIIGSMPASYYLTIHTCSFFCLVTWNQRLRLSLHGNRLSCHLRCHQHPSPHQSIGLSPGCSTSNPTSWLCTWESRGPSLSTLWEPQWSSWILAIAWPNPTHSDYLDRKPADETSLCHSSSLTLWNKWKKPLKMEIRSSVILLNPDNPSQCLGNDKISASLGRNE